MKQFLALALLSTFGMSAFAQSQFAHNDPRRDSRYDNRRDDRYGRHDDRRDRNDGGIVGAIIGNAIRDALDLDRDHSRRGYRDQVTCEAQNRRGQRFYAVGNRPRFVQDDAIRQCYNYGSRECYPTGCRNGRRW